MRILARLRSWFGSLTRRSRLESEMDRELRFHLESYAEDLERQGIARPEALRRARLEFGGMETQKEECRASLGLRLWDELRADVRYGWRNLARSPGFTAIAVISLALGIGANTAIFSLARAVLYKTMGVRDAERLRLFTWVAGPKSNIGSGWGNFGKNARGEPNGTPFPYPLFLEMRRHQGALEDLAAFKDASRLTATVQGQAESVDSELVSGNFYSSIGARVIAGRAIDAADDTPSATPVAVISDAWWSRRFGRSADALGRTIFINSVPVTTVGVNDPRFHGAKTGSTAEVFLPIALQPRVIPSPAGSLLSKADFWWVTLIGRLKPNTSDTAAQTSLALAFRNAVRTTIGPRPDDRIPRLELVAGSRGLDTQTENFAEPIAILLTLAGLVLLIACLNLANLLLARSSARHREMSVRVAMGASRWRIMRQVLTESLMLACAGGAAGLLLGYASRNLIPSLFENSWRTSSVQGEFDWTVFLFASVLTILTGLLFGGAPAWRATRVAVHSALKDGGRSTAGTSRALLGKGLVVFQVALSVLLLIGAGLFVRTLSNLRSAAIGFNPERILLFGVDPPRSRYAKLDRTALFGRIEESVAALPGVESATLSSEPLLAQSGDDGCFRPTGRAPRSPREDSAWMNNVGSRFFETLGIPILYGRGFNAHDTWSAPKVAVINQQLAHSFFPSSNPLGQSISVCGGDGPDTIVQVVGVGADTKYASIREDVPGTIYMPYLQKDDAGQVTFELKTAASTASITAALRKAVGAVDKDLPLLDVRTQFQQIDATLSQERMFAALTSAFGLLALVLASIGIYGVMAYTVSRRTNEIGIRMALGAQPRGVLAMVLREAGLLAVLGVVLGVAAALGLTRVVASMLYGVQPVDPLTFVAAALLLLALAATAGAVPARRAASVDPMRALRHE